MSDDDKALDSLAESIASTTKYRYVSPELVRAVDFLLRTQSADGFWHEEEFTGTGFPRHFYLRYWMYRAYFPLMALGQFTARCAVEGVSA